MVSLWLLALLTMTAVVGSSPAPAMSVTHAGVGLVLKASLSPISTASSWVRPNAAKPHGSDVEVEVEVRQSTTNKNKGVGGEKKKKQRKKWRWGVCSRKERFSDHRSSGNKRTNKSERRVARLVLTFNMFILFCTSISSIQIFNT